MEEFVTFRKFIDTEAAEEVCELLTNAEIEHRLLDSSHAYVKFAGYSQIEPGIIINIQSKDFERADKVLDSYYLKQIETVDKDHYIFEFSDDELKEIIKNPYDWGSLDFHLAKKLLNDKGFEFSGDYAEERKAEKLKELSQVKKVSTYKLVIGYIFAIFLPAVSLIIGLLIVNTRNVLPNGEKPYAYTNSDRLHGKIMVTISVIWVTIFILKLGFV